MPSPTLFPSFSVSTSLQNSQLPSSQQCRGMEMGAELSSPHVVSAYFSPGTGHLTLFTCSSISSLPRGQTNANFPSVSPSLGCSSSWTASVWVPSMGWSPLGTDCSRLGFCPLLNTLPQRQYHHCCWALPWPAAGPPWSWLALALLEMREAARSFSQKPPLHPSGTKTGSHKHNTFTKAAL